MKREDIYMYFPGARGTFWILVLPRSVYTTHLHLKLQSFQGCFQGILFFFPMPSPSASQFASVNNSGVALTDNLLAVSPGLGAPMNDQNVLGRETDSPTDQQPTMVVSHSRFLFIMLNLWLRICTAYFNKTTTTTAMHIIGAG